MSLWIPAHPGNPLQHTFEPLGSGTCGQVQVIQSCDVNIQHLGNLH